MKIVHYIASLGGGGKERRMLETVKSLSNEEQIEQFVVLYNNNSDYIIPVEDDHIFVIGRENRIYAIWSLYSALHKIKPDVVHVWSEVHFTLLSLTLFKFLLNYKLIAGFIADANPYPTFWTEKICKLSYMFSDCIVSNSKAGLMAKGAPLYKSRVLYNCFSFNRLVNISEADVTKFKEETNISNPYIVTMVARFTDDKDYSMFIDVAKSMVEERDDICFIAVGKGPNLDKYKFEVERLGINNIRFLGFRSDIDTIWASSSVGVLFTNSEKHAEGVSNSIMEAMALGVPVIATRGGGTEEIIIDNQNGFIIEPKDVKNAIQRITLLLNNKHRLGDNARKTIKDKFSVENTRTGYSSMYRSLKKV